MQGRGAGQRHGGQRKAWATKHQPWLVETLDVANGGNLVPGGLDALLEEWADGLAKPETRRAYVRDVEGFLAHAVVQTDRQLLDVREHQVAVWRDFLRRELEAGRLSYQSCKRRMAAATSLYDFLNREGHITKNPVRPVKRPPRPELDRIRDRVRRQCASPHCPVAAGDAANDVGNPVPDMLARLVHGRRRQLTLW